MHRSLQTPHVRPEALLSGLASEPASVPALVALCEELGLVLEPRQHTKLLSYLSLLQRWNGTYNLTAVREPAAMFTQHLADCLAIVRPTQRALSGQSAARVLDVGSGGGLPAVVLAVCLPSLQISCIDAVGKKMAFVRQVVGELQLPQLQVVHGRIEDMKAPLFDLITARAFASLVDLVRLTGPLLKPGGRWMAMKGRAPDDEIAALPTEIEVFHVEPLQVPGLDAQRCLVWMKQR